MASWAVKFVSGSDTTLVELIDSFGPNNDWRARDPDALLPNSGTFTNQTKRVVPAVQPSWILNDFDIDAVNVGDTGPGDMLDNDGTYPEGVFKWEVVSEL